MWLFFIGGEKERQVNRFLTTLIRTLFRQRLARTASVNPVGPCVAVWNERKCRKPTGGSAMSPKLSSMQYQDRSITGKLVLPE